MAEDFGLKATVTADSSGYKKGLNDAQKATKKFSSTVSSMIQGLGKNGLVGALGAVGLASSGLTATIGAVKKIVQNVTKVVNECTEAYKKQYLAELALDTAVKNSPYVNGSATKALKDFASQIQKTSNVGDEEILPMMTKLIASGRTEAETMKIIATATDMSASGTISFETAITQLNQSMNGSIGRLGQQYGELQNLTEEELKNGKAVDILAGKYEGLAKTTIDSSKQLKNAIGDLKEAYGATFEKALSPMRTFFKDIIQGWADAKKAKQEYEGAVEAVASGNADIAQLQTVIDENQKQLEAFDKLVEQKAEQFKKTREEILQNWIMYLNSDEMEKYSSGDLFGPKQAEELERQNYLLNGRLRVMQRIEEAEAKIKEERQKEAEAEAERLEKEKSVEELKERYLAKIAEQEAKWQNIKTVTGEVTSNEEKIKFYEDQLVAIMTEAGGQITTNNQYYKDQIEIIKKLQEGLTPEEKKTSTEWAGKIREQAIERIEAEKEVALERLEIQNASESEILNTVEYYNDQLRELNRQRIEEERAQALASVKDYANAEEERVRINKYYDNEILDNNLKFIVDYKKQGEQIKKNYSDIFKKVADSAKSMANSIKKVFSGITKVVKGVVSSTKNIFLKLFKFDPDEALDNLLVFEDSVLTFFVETLPKMPAFVKSALQSIAVLFKTLTKNVDKKQLSTIIKDMVQSLTATVPSIITDVIQVGSVIVGGIMEGLSNSLPALLTTGLSVFSTIIDSITNYLPSIFEALSMVGEKIIPKLQEVMTSIFGFLGEFLQSSIPVVIQLLFDFIGLIIQNLPTVIKVLVEALPVLINSIVEMLPKFFADDLPALISGFIEIIPDIVKAGILIVASIVTHLPEILGGVITGIVKIFTDTDWAKLLSGMWEGIKQGFQSLGDVISSIMKAPINFIIDGINLLISGLNKISFKLPNWDILGDLKGAKFGIDIPKIKKLAIGTDNATKGLALVGEAGPELVRFNGGEQVLNNRNTQKALAGAGKGDNIFNVTFEYMQDTTAYAVVKQLKQYNRQMAINSII